MKKNLTVLLAALLMGGTAFGQAVSDRNIIPVAVNLNQVLRMNINNGGNIEFMFNTIDEYKLGISGDAGTSSSANDAGTDDMYQTNFTIASSTTWELSYGAEQATFIGTDDPANTGLALDNVGFSIVSDGAHSFGTELLSAPTSDGAAVADLDPYPVALLTDAGDAANANAGDVTDNDFTITWRCGTIEGDMNAVRLIEQSITPDRYVANVLFELSAL